MNKDSSRSHSLFTIYIEVSEKDTKNNERITAGKIKSCRFGWIRKAK